MADPLLTTLCTICHARPRKYTCPRCSSNTCSLACSKRHKARSQCSGVRDPTVYMPPRELYTAKGLDHDYNFISSIERGVNRSDKRIVEELKLVDRRELFSGGDVRNGYRRAGGGGAGGRYNDNDNVNGFVGGRAFAGRRGEPTALERGIWETGVQIMNAPKGMQRNVENTTKYSKAQRCVNWTVEWIEEDGKRTLGTCLGKWAVRKVWGQAISEERRSGWSKNERKRWREEKEEERKAKRAKVERPLDISPSLAPVVLQDFETTCWTINVIKEDTINEAAVEAEENELEWIQETANLHFYLLKPNTPAKQPKVLIPIENTEPLTKVLHGQLVLEYPTIYVLHQSPSELSKEYTTADAFSKAKRKTAGAKLVTYGSDDSDGEDDEDVKAEEEEASPDGEESSSSDDDDDASSSSEESDEEMKDADPELSG